MTFRPLSVALLAISLTAPVIAQAPAAKPTPIPAPESVAKPPADATKTASGLSFKILQPGTGTEHPGPKDMVTVNYTGWSTDGRMFDSSLPRNAPSTFPVDMVIKGWGEGVRLMTAGEKRRLWIPQDLAYNGAAGRPAGMLVFDIELLSFQADPTAAPPDVKAPPADSKKTNSGLAYKVLKPGTGTNHPTRSSTVTVNYTGWTTDGKVFDTSIGKKPISFGLGDVIAGWTEGVQLMVVGEKARFWIPEKLAYKGESAPYGLLVFDVELIAIK